ncbi:MAG: GNAT family N-acetyltransferase [Gemmatimonadaceae bacterium]|nr:GNAT family N-acetyltransferase [Gemmatimonadaceae bacterium]
MLQTTRLRLVPFTPQQFVTLIEAPERFAALAGVPAAPGLREFFTSGEIQEAWLTNLRTLERADPWTLGFAVIHREVQSVIGSAGFKGPPDESGMVEVAYGIVPAFENRGHATEATQALVAFAFGHESVSLVRAHTLPTNNASTHVLTKCGFQRAGEFDDPDDGLVWRWERTERPD